MGTREKLVIVLLTVVAIMAIPELAQNFYPRISWDHYSDEGRRLILFGDKDKAVEYYKGEVSKVIQTKGVRDPAYIAVLEGLAQAYQRQDMYISAEDQYKEALAQMRKNWAPDRLRMKETMQLMSAMYEKQGETKKVAYVQHEITALNPWWQWFWSCFIITFCAEALYMAVVLSRPEEIEVSHLKVEHGMLYLFALLVSTVGMLRGLLMAGMVWHQAIFLASGITICGLPFVFGAVLMCAKTMGQENSKILLEGVKTKRIKASS